MSEENKTLVIRLYQELDRKNFGAFSDLCTSTFASHFPGRPGAQTREDREQTSRALYEAIPDLRHTVDEVIGEGDVVAMRFTAQGTHKGSFHGAPPTGKPIAFTGMRFYRIVGGQLAEEWACFDSAGLMRQLGATQQ